jgi:hypothetical protein
MLTKMFLKNNGKYRIISWPHFKSPALKYNTYAKTMTIQDID